MMLWVDWAQSGTAHRGPFMQLRDVAPQLPHVAWTSWKHGGGVPRASLTKGQSRSVRHFYDLASELMWLRFQCTLPVTADTKFHPGSKGGDPNCHSVGEKSVPL